MARSIVEIQQSIIDAKNADPTLAQLNSSSRAAIWLLWTWVVATCMWVTENLFDSHKAEVADIINNQAPHSAQWYAYMAKRFQLGYALPDGSDTYEVIDTSAQIVAFAAVVELSNRLRIKVAKLVGGVLTPLTNDELVAFVEYMNRVKDAGIKLSCTSSAADTLRVQLNVFFDPLVLNALGKRLDGTNDTPVQDAITAFVKAIPFNGVFVLNSLIAAIQKVEGVTIGEMDYCAARYGVLPFSVITSAYTPDAGYLILDGTFFTDNTIYTAYGVV